MGSFWKIFRMLFVLFFLYLTGDAFYRWDGFRYYASFHEFIASIGLVAVLWTLMAFAVTVPIWLFLESLMWFFRKVRLKIGHEHVFVMVSIFLCLCLFLRFAKVLRVPHVIARFLHWDLSSLLIIAVISLLLSWLFRNKAAFLMNEVQDRITPLVWMFSVIVILSGSLVVYQTWLKEEANVVEARSSEFIMSDRNRPNIILVTFDAMTARDMSVYGYHRQTTPFMNEWAKRASLFREVKAGSNITTPTTASLMTGKRVWTHQAYHIVDSSKPVKSETENIPLMLKKGGYFTMAFVVNPFASVRKLGISGSFDIAPIETGFSKQASLLGYVDAVLYNLFGNKIKLYNWILQRDFILFKVLNKVSRNISRTTAPPEEAFNNLLMVLDKKSPTPFFAWIHLYPPHDPYLPPAPFMGAFDSSPSLRTYMSQEEAVHDLDKYNDLFEEFPPDAVPMVNVLRARYDEFIKYCDKQFEVFMSALLKRNLLENTVVMISSDHGESFEHNHIKHSHNNLYEQVTHIPLIIKMPGQKNGRIINDLVEQTDISATILDLADIPLPLWIEGRSLVPLMQGTSLPSKPVFSMSFEGLAIQGQKITMGRIAVWENNYKLIHQLEDNKSQLFNMEEDPGETQNLFNKESFKGQHLLKLIHDNLKKANYKISGEE